MKENSCMGLLPKSKLTGFPRRLPLVRYIAFDGCPVASVAYGGEIISIRPELASPQFFPQYRKSLEEFSGSNALEHADYRTPAVFGMK